MAASAPAHTDKAEVDELVSYDWEEVEGEEEEEEGGGCSRLQTGCLFFSRGTLLLTNQPADQRECGAEN